MRSWWGRKIHWGCSRWQKQQQRFLNWCDITLKKEHGMVCRKTSKGCMHCWDESLLLEIRRDPANIAAFVLSMVRLLKGSWCHGCERIVELWGLSSLYFPVQGREHVITQSANHWLTTGTQKSPWTTQGGHMHTRNQSHIYHTSTV